MLAPMAMSNLTACRDEGWGREGGCEWVSEGSREEEKKSRSQRLVREGGRERERRSEERREEKKRQENSHR